MSATCGKCDLGPVNNNDKVFCDICRQSFHDVCVGISRQEASCLRAKERRITFFCGKCNVMDTLKQLKEDIDTLKSEMQKIKDEKLQHQKENVNSISSEQLITETEERKRRAKNLIIYNIDESNDTHATSRLEDDKNKVIRAIAQICTIDTSRITAYRIGKFDANKKRPIKAILDSEENVITVLKNKNKIDSGIKFASDKTKMQQKYLHDLIAKLDAMKTQGTTNKKIKYVKGVPTIVDDVSTNHPSDLPTTTEGPKN